MEKLITKEFLEKEHHQEAIQGIEAHLGRSLVVGETIGDDGALCDGKECPAGQICLLGHCVDDDVPSVNG